MTTTPATQAILSAIRHFVRHEADCHVTSLGEDAPCSCGARVALSCFDDLIARQSHSLPGDVGVREALKPFALISEEGLCNSPNADGYVTITTQADYFHRARAALTPSPDGKIWCERCQGNGELVTDWELYKASTGDADDEACLIDCPDCDGQGERDALTPSALSANWIASGIPDDAIAAGIEAWRAADVAMKAREQSANPEDMTDWDEGMIVAAIFKAVSGAMSGASALSGEGE